MELVEKAILNSHGAVADLFKSYGFNEPATYENVGLAYKKFGLPFLADLEELIINPYADFILSLNDNELDYAIGRRKKTKREKSPGRLRTKIQERRASKPQRKAERKDLKEQRKRQKQIDREEAKAYKQANKATKREHIGGSVLAAASETIPDIIDDVISGDFNVMDSISSVLSGIGAGTDYYQDANFDNDPNAYLDEEFERSNAVYAQRAESRKKLLMYLGIGIGAIILFAAIILLTRKKGKK